MARTDRRARITGIVVTSLVAGLVAPASAQWRPLGPFRAGEHNPLYRLFLVHHADGADVVDRGSFRAESSVAYSNIFELSRSPTHFQRFDMERMTNSFTVRYGAAPRLEVGGRIGIHTSWGGFLDPFVSGFHDFFGFPNGNREDFPDGEYEFLLMDTRRRVRLDVPRSSPGLEDLRLFAKRSFGGDDDGSSATAVRATFRLASGTFTGGGARPDVSVAGLHRRSWGRFHLHLQAGVTSLNAPPELDPVARNVAGIYSAAAEVNIVPALSFLAQGVGSTPYVEGFDDTVLDRGSMNLVLGFAGTVGTSWRWTFSFAEDVPPNSPSADFTLDLGVSRAF